MNVFNLLMMKNNQFSSVWCIGVEGLMEVLQATLAYIVLEEWFRMHMTFGNYIGQEIGRAHVWTPVTG